MWKAGFPAEATQARGKSGRARTKPRGNPLTDGLNRVKRGLRRTITEGALLLPFLLTPASLSFNPANTGITPFITPAVLRAEEIYKDYKVENIVDEEMGWKGIRIYVGDKFSLDVYGENERPTILRDVQVGGYTIPLIEVKDMVISNRNLHGYPRPIFALEFPGWGGASLVYWNAALFIGFLMSIDPEAYQQILSQGTPYENAIIVTGVNAYNVIHGTYGQWELGEIHPSSPPKIKLDKETLEYLAEKIESGADTIVVNNIRVKRTEIDLEKAFENDWRTSKMIKEALRTGKTWEETGEKAGYRYTKIVEPLISPSLKRKIINDIEKIAQKVEDYIGEERSLTAKWRKDRIVMKAMAEWINSKYAPSQAQNPFLFNGSPWQTIIDLPNGWILFLGQQGVIDALNKRFGGFPKLYKLTINDRYDLLLGVGRGDYDKDGTPMLRIVLIMIDKEMGYVHLLEEAFVRTDEVDEFLEAFSTYGGAARLIVNVDGRSFESLLTIFPVYMREGLYISQSQTPISHIIGGGNGRFIQRARMLGEDDLIKEKIVRVAKSFGLDGGENEEFTYFVNMVLGRLYGMNEGRILFFANGISTDIKQPKKDPLRVVWIAQK